MLAVIWMLMGYLFERFPQAKRFGSCFIIQSISKSFEMWKQIRKSNDICIGSEPVRVSIPSLYATDHCIEALTHQYCSKLDIEFGIYILPAQKLNKAERIGQLMKNQMTQIQESRKEIENSNDRKMLWLWSILALVLSIISLSNSWAIVPTILSIIAFFKVRSRIHA